MWRELRTTLAIMLVVLIAGAPLIFADAPQAQPMTSYMALVFQLKPSATPTLIPPPTATTTRTPTPTVIPTATPPVLATPTPTLPPPSYNNCQADPNPNAAPNYPIRITNIDKAAETVTLKNVSPDPIDLAGWHMCSIRGNQEHPISGTLAPGAQVDFVGSSGPIWRNDEQDDGALYNAQGQLVSYWRDL
jgi:Lamin Tail Domain